MTARNAAGSHERHSQIAAAARDLFSTQGYDATSVDQIARAAGVSRATVFRDFGTKDDILFVCYERVLADLRGPTRAHRASDADRIRRVVLKAAAHLDAERDTFLQEVRLIAAHSRLRSRSVLLLYAWAECLAQDLVGNRPGGVGLRTRVLAHVGVAGFQQAICTWRELDGQRSLVRLTTKALRLALPSDASADREFTQRARI